MKEVRKDDDRVSGYRVNGCAPRLIPVRSLQTLPPQWVNADLRALDVSVLGKFEVVVADPPWAIHQEVSSLRSLSPSLRAPSHLS